MTHVEALSKYDTSLTKMIVDAILYFDLVHTFSSVWKYGIASAETTGATTMIATLVVATGNAIYDIDSVMVTLIRLHSS